MTKNVYTVALRMESVGRNIWKGENPMCETVALRMESVGRNRGLMEELDRYRGRSPHGERG